jgi:hypothetical protein
MKVERRKEGGSKEGGRVIKNLKDVEMKEGQEK